jgi:2-polyprenyl-3-methyl-5-hydroxy-6-metoxy-1,4-benzoquinol methylase
VDLSYDRARVAALYDAYGDQEWNRHETSPAGRVSFHIHRHYLTRYIHEGDRVLETGAGAGRFTVELATLGARIVTTDISPGQLELNASHVAEAGLESSVEARETADIIDLSRYPDGTFDSVVSYGGPLSYVMDRADDALQELLRVTRPDGHVLISVMSLHRSMHAFLGAAADEIEVFGVEEMQAILDTGDLPTNHSSLGMPTHLFSWAELRALLERHACDLVVASAANFLSIGNDEVCERWRQDPAMGDRLLAWELGSCRQPGVIDGGTHIIAVVRRR